MNFVVGGVEPKCPSVSGVCRTDMHRKTKLLTNIMCILSICCVSEQSIELQANCHNPGQRKAGLSNLEWYYYWKITTTPPPKHMGQSDQDRIRLL